MVPISRADEMIDHCRRCGKSEARSAWTLSMHLTKFLKFGMVA
jgi:ribosomal protein L37AE/L43A